MQTIYEGNNITSLVINSEEKVLFAADRDDHKIVRFEYDDDLLEDRNMTAPEPEPIYFKLE